MNIVGIIPARYGSTRFPGKPLALIHGKPMVVHAIESAARSNVLSAVVVATDDARIAAAVEQAGYRAIMTRDDHPSGTDRCLEALEVLSGTVDAVVNIQGDEPFVPAESIATLTELLRGGASIATLAQPLDRDAAENPNRVKVVRNGAGKALYFSRSVIPFDRNRTAPDNCLLHIGLYGYVRSALQRITRYPISDLEQTESLEQLRWLENGEEIQVGITTHASVSVDTPEDLERLLRKPFS